MGKIFSCLCADYLDFQQNRLSGNVSGFRQNSMVDYSLFDSRYYSLDVSSGSAVVDAFESIYPRYKLFPSNESPFFSDILFNSFAYERRTRRRKVCFSFKRKRLRDQLGFDLGFKDTWIIDTGYSVDIRPFSDRQAFSAQKFFLNAHYYSCRSYTFIFSFIFKKNYQQNKTGDFETYPFKSFKNYRRCSPGRVYLSG